MFNSCIDRFYMSPSSGASYLDNPSGIWSPCQISKRCNLILQASKSFCVCGPWVALNCPIALGPGLLCPRAFLPHSLVMSSETLIRKQNVLLEKRTKQYLRNVLEG